MAGTVYLFIGRLNLISCQKLEINCERSVCFKISCSMLRKVKWINFLFPILDHSQVLINFSFEDDLSPEQLVTIIDRYILCLENTLVYPFCVTFKKNRNVLIRIYLLHLRTLLQTKQTALTLLSIHNLDH